jgi:metal-responsive CopG/Arc/MetJ family transcriptional regulator
MKTAVSIPDPIFEAAEAMSKRLGLSRSELYTRALRAFITTHQKQDVTEVLNQVYGKHPSSVDPVMTQLQFASLPHEEW